MRNASKKAAKIMAETTVAVETNGKKGSKPNVTSTDAVAAPALGALAAIPAVNVVSVIKLSDIFADSNWNSRGLDRTINAGASIDSPEDKSEKSTGFAGLVFGIEWEGQDTPVDVRKNPDPKSKYPYVLVTGFRRFRAIEHIAAKDGHVGQDPKWNPKAPTIRAFDHGVMSERDARRLNMRENTQRDDLTGADLAWGVWEMAGRKLVKDGDITDSALAKELGKTQGYTSMLRRIMGTLDPKVTAHWRIHTHQLPVALMHSIVDAEIPRSKHWEAYNDLLKKKESARADGKWVTAATTRGEAIGEMLGKLKKAQFSFEKPNEAEFLAVMDHLFKIPKKDPTKAPTAAQLKSVAKAMFQAYEKAAKVEAADPKAN